MNLVQTDREGLMLDRESGAILNVDNARLDAYRKKKSAAEEAARTASRVDRLEESLTRIESLLAQLVDRK